MSTNKVGQGIALLVSSAASTGICALLSIFLFAGATRSAVKAHKGQMVEQPTSEELLRREREAMFGPDKRSLRLNLNSASSAELQSLPGIGPSRAELIIAHRPYQSVDELAKLRGIGSRLTDDLRPFLKTDGQTERIKPPSNAPTSDAANSPK